MNPQDYRTLSRDVLAVAIPYGDRLVLKEGSHVQIAQAMGGHFTVVTDQGYMVRIDGKDADALGETPLPAAQTPESVSAPADPSKFTGPLDEEKIWDELRTVYDPEIPVNIVDLGLVYVMRAEPHPEGGYRVHLEMTMTAPGCGMGDYLKMDAEQKVRAVPGVRDVDVEIVWEPQWERSRMSDAARLQLGMF